MRFPMPMQLAGEDSLTDSKSRFLNWLDNTFAGDGPEAGGTGGGTPDGNKRTHRKAMWDDKGEFHEVVIVRGLKGLGN